MAAATIAASAAGTAGAAVKAATTTCLRTGRMLAQGDLRLIALALIAEQPRHGYDIIKALEEKTSDWYSPSPGIVYPTLTYLEEIGQLTGAAGRRQEAATPSPRMAAAHLAQNRDLVDAVMKRLRLRRRKGRAHPRPHARARRNASEAARYPLVQRGDREPARHHARAAARTTPMPKPRSSRFSARAAGEIRKLQ